MKKMFNTINHHKMQFKLYVTTIRMAKTEMLGSTNTGKNVPLNKRFQPFNKKITSFPLIQQFTSIYSR